MKTETYNKLREIVIRANPDILKLEFGCEVKALWEVEPEKYDRPHAFVLDTHEWKGWVKLFNYHLGEQKVSKSAILEILGRPIRLADILLAISKEEFASGFTAHPNGDLSFTDYLSDDGQDGSCSGSWNLLKDDLRDQSDECGEFLLALLEEK